jgi:anti-anti-sigma regulatory factor
MLRITFDTAPSDGHYVDVLKLEGELAGRWVQELRRTCDDALQDGADSLLLDLRAVTFIDLDGVALFRELGDRVSVTNCSFFAAEQLKELLAARLRGTPN